MSSKDGHNLITNMKVQYHTSFGDHIPLTLDISTECIPELETVVTLATISESTGVKCLQQI